MEFYSQLFVMLNASRWALISCLFFCPEYFKVLDVEPCLFFCFFPHVFLNSSRLTETRIAAVHPVVAVTWLVTSQTDRNWDNEWR